MAIQNPNKTAEILKHLSSSTAGLTVHQLRDALNGDSSISDLSDHLSILSSQGLVHLVKGHLWRPHGMFPADAIGTLISSPDSAPSEWSNIKRLCRYYHDCNLLSGSKGMSLWSDREGNIFSQIAESVDWEILASGESIYLDENIVPISMRLAFQRDPNSYICGPVYVGGGKSPILPVFISPCAVEWIKAHSVIRLTLTAHPEVNEEWLSKVARNFDRREDIVCFFGQNEETSEPKGVGALPHPDLTTLYARLRQLLDEDPKFNNIIQEAPCLSSANKPTPLSGCAKRGIYNRLLIVRQSSAIFTQRLQKEMRHISHAKTEDLEKTSLRFFLQKHIPTQANPQQIQTPAQLDVLSPDQRRAVSLAMQQNITLVSGPPGTGKSRVVANAMINALMEGKSVLFASRNHQAIDAVVPYLNQLCRDSMVVGRLSAPFGENSEDPLMARIRSLMDAMGDSDGDAYSDPRGNVKRVNDSREYLDQLRKTLTLQAKGYEEAVTAMSKAETMLTEFGSDASTIFKAAQTVPKDLLEDTETFFSAYLPLCRELPRFFILRWFFEKLRDHRSKALFEKWEKLSSSISQYFTGTRAAKLSEELPLEAFDPNQAETCLQLVVSACQTARALKSAGKAMHTARDANDSAENIQLAIRKQEGLLCNLSRETISMMCDQAGQHATDDERQTIANLMATMNVGGRETKIQGMVRKAFPELLKHAPLWAVSNLSAGRYLPLAPGLFDLLIVDEASQCDIPSVIPLLYRAKRIMVVGDSKQLSFVAGISKSANQRLRVRHGIGSADPFDRFDYRAQSFFDLVNGLKQTRNDCRVMLRDHYRCDPDIAAYFNKAFYRERLFINTDTAKLKKPDNKRFSVRWHQLPADAERHPGSGAISRNQIEAITTELKRLAEVGFPGTVGVVTPFRSQADRIRDRVMAEFNSNTPAHWQFKSSTADGFQGGERDVILLSLVGGPELPPSCAWFYESNRNRFNVAVSRARAVLHIFGDRDWTYKWAGEKDNRKHLRLLAEIARTDEDEARSTEDDSSQSIRKKNPPIDGDAGLIGPVWEPKFAHALWDAGLPVRQQYAACGRSLDIALIRKGLKLGIEVDGEAYHRGTDGNRRREDIERDLVLMANGWTIKRFWVYELREDWQQCVDDVVRLWEKVENGDQS